MVHRAEEMVYFTLQSSIQKFKKYENKTKCPICYEAQEEQFNSIECKVDGFISKVNTMCWNKAAWRGRGWVLDRSFSMWQ